MKPATLYSVHTNDVGGATLLTHRLFEIADSFIVEAPPNFVHFCSKGEVYGYYQSYGAWCYNVWTARDEYDPVGYAYFKDDLVALQVTINRLVAERDALHEQSCRRSQQLDSVRQIKSERMGIGRLEKIV